MVHHSPGPWSDFDRLHPPIFREAGRRAEVLIVDFSLRRHLERGRHLDHEVRRADLPPVGERRRRWKLIAVPFGGSAVYPADDGVALGGGQTPLVGETANRRIGVPRRHLAIEHLVLDGPAPRSGLLVRNERHGRHFARAMAVDAGLVQDRRHVLAERWHRGSRFRTGYRRTGDGECAEHDDGAGRTLASGLHLHLPLRGVILSDQ